MVKTNKKEKPALRLLRHRLQRRRNASHGASEEHTENEEDTEEEDPIQTVAPNPSVQPENRQKIQRFVLTFLICVIVLFSAWYGWLFLQQNQCQVDLKNDVTPLGATQKGDATSSVDALEKTLRQAWQHMVKFCLPSVKNMDYCMRKFPDAIEPPQEYPASDTPQITMTTHTTAAKLDRLLTQVKWWGGPVSAAIYVDKIEHIDSLLHFVTKKREELANVTLHIALEQHNTEGYPHNKLRNLALDFAKTDYVLLMDVDLVTNPGAHDKMANLIQSDAEVYKRLHSRHVFALPPFNVKARPGENLATEDMLPRTKEEVVRGVKDDTMAQFYAGLNPGSDMFHDYTSWYLGYDGDRTFKESEFRDFTEPYALIYRHGLPPYHEELRGYGLDKVSFYWMLAMVMDFKFCVLRDFYVAHLEHPRVDFEALVAGDRRNSPIFNKYKNDMMKLHGK